MDGASRRERTHYTFDELRLQEIDRGNQRLLNRLNNIASRGPARPAGTATRLKSAAEIRREKEEREIERKNAILLQKLKTAKSTIPTANPRARAVRPVAQSANRTGVSSRVGTSQNNAQMPPSPNANDMGGSMSPTSPSRPMPERYLKSGGGTSGTVSPSMRRPMFRNARDLDEIAFAACPEKHLYD